MRNSVDSISRKRKAAKDAKEKDRIFGLFCRVAVNVGPLLTCGLGTRELSCVRAAAVVT